MQKSVDADSSSVNITKLAAGGGTKLVPQKDGSVLATGPNPATQTYQIDFTLGDKATRAIRLEALTHESLVSKSTGRAHNGNFVLSEIKIEAAPGGSPDADLKPVAVREMLVSGSESEHLKGEA